MFSIRRHDQEPFLLCLYYSFPSNLLDSPLLSGIRIISVHLSVAYVATPFHYLMPQIGIFAAERSRKCHKYTKLYEAKLVAHVIPINRPGMQSLYSYTSALYYNCRQATFHKVAGGFVTPSPAVFHTPSKYLYGMSYCIRSGRVLVSSGTGRFFGAALFWTLYCTKLLLPFSEFLILLCLIFLEFFCEILSRSYRYT